MEVWTPWTKWCVLQKHEAMASTTAYEHARRGSSKRFCDFHDKLVRSNIECRASRNFSGMQKNIQRCILGIGIRKCPGEDQ
ncbi:Ribosome maturation protein [Trichinella spiralis]|uniref:Ribosome maturation protein n=1 Tax=Trichinella spiralis TaxID=6334 RepID=A0ABR3K7T7_TRISP